jgi:hypothetical protein
MKKDNLGCDEVVLPVEVFNQYGTAQKYVEALRAENVTLSESVTSQALLIASLKEEHFETLFKINKEYMRLMNSYIFERFGGDSETLPDEGFEQEVLDRIVPALTQQLSDTQRQNAKLIAALTPLAECYLPPQGYRHLGVTAHFRTEQITAACAALSASKVSNEGDGKD